MRTLEAALSSFSKTLEGSRQRSGENGLTSNLTGTVAASALNGTTSGITGPAETPLAGALSLIGPQPGALTVVALPRTAEEAERQVLALVGTSLPPCMQHWLAAQEETQRTGLPAFPVVRKPERTPEMIAAISNSVKSLSELLAPAKHRRPELLIEVGKLFAAFNVFTGDVGKMAAQTEVWCEELEDLPLFAIRRARKRALRAEKKLPSLSEFLYDARAAIGTGAANRRRTLENWLRD
jgi:hypothetical protein